MILRKRKIITRIISYLTAGIMLLSPLFSYVGADKGGRAKAEEPVAEFQISFNADGDRTYYYSGQKNVKIVNKSNSTHYYKLVDSDGNVSADWEEIVEDGFSADTASVKEIRFADSNTATTATCVYTLASAEYYESAEYGWYSSGAKITDTSTAVSSAEIKGAASEYIGEDKYHIGKVRYAYAKYIDGKEGALDYTNLSWSDSAVSLDGASVAESGKYIGFIGYFSDNDVYQDSTKAGIVNLDVTAPDIQSVVLQQYDGANWNDVSGDVVDENKIRYTLADEQYRYKAVISDVGSGIKIDGVALVSKSDAAIRRTFTYDGVENAYLCIISETDIPAYENAGTDWKLVAEDTLGNVNEEPELLQLKRADTASEFIDVGIKYDGEITELPAVGNTLYIKKLDAAYNLVGAFRSASTKNLDMRIVFDGGEDVCSEQKVTANAVTRQSTISSDVDIPVPADVTAYQVIGEIKFEMYDDDASNVFLSQKYGSIIYDPSVPEIQNVVLQYKDKSEAGWTDADPSEILDGVCYINTSKYDVRYKLKVAEEGSGIKDNGVVCADEDQNTYPVTKDLVDGSIYYIEIPGTSISEDKSLSLSVTAEDKAGNISSDAKLSPRVRASKTEIIMTAKLVDKNDNYIVIDDDNKLNSYVKDAHKLVVTVSSGDKISEVKFTANAYSKEGTIENTYDMVSKRYTAKVSFVIPSDVKTNIHMQDMKVHARDEGDIEASMPLGELFYDKTEPVVLKSDGSAEISAENKWVKPYKLSFLIKSGNENMSVESVVSSAKYTISNAKDSNYNGSFNLMGAHEETDMYREFTVPESASILGTHIVFAVEDKSQNASTKELYAYVDGTKPTLNAFSVDSETNLLIPFGGQPTISAVVKDNLTISSIVLEITYPGNAGVKRVTKNFAANEAVGNNIEESISHKLEPLSGNSIPDGEYRVKITAVDKAGNTAELGTKKFVVDNTLPVVTVKTASGTLGGKKPGKNFDGTDFDYYYSSNVDVELTYEDTYIQSVTVTDNGNVIQPVWTEDSSNGKYKAVINVTKDGRHNIKISAVDEAGNRSVEKQIEFIKDTGKPTISLLINGAIIYNDSMGVVDFTGDAVISASVSDMCEDKNDLNYQVITNVPDKPARTSEYLKTANRVFSFGEEADYKVNFYAVDMAGNLSQTKSVNFRVDKTAPNISIAGALGGTSADAATVTFTMQEAFWRDASGTVNIYRKAGDGEEEALFKTIDFKPTAFETSVSEILSDTGIYRIEFEAADRVGHTATASRTFTIDRDAPEIIISGVNNYDVTDQTVEFSASIKDDFYSGKTVSVNGTRTDIDGRVNPISFSDFNEKGNPTIISESFDEDGIYDIEVTSVDIAGNSHSSKVHFTVDKTAPVIADLSEYDGTVVSSFNWTEDLDALVSDLTVCDIHMYLNGSEYDGMSEIADGSYMLFITAEDEMGHYVERTVSFVLDTKAPVFIVTGVEDGEVRDDVYNIGISLQLEEDILQSVTLNGESITITDNTAAINVEKKGKYTLRMTAIDEAGNTIEETIEFQYGQVSNWWIWLIIVIAILLIVVIVIVVIKNLKKK